MRRNNPRHGNGEKQPRRFVDKRSLSRHAGEQRVKDPKRLWRKNKQKNIPLEELTGGDMSLPVIEDTE